MCVVGSGLGMSQSSRLSSSVSAMRVLNTGSDVEEALADALVKINTDTYGNSAYTLFTHKFTYPFIKQLHTQNLTFGSFKKRNHLSDSFVYTHLSEVQGQ